MLLNMECSKLQREEGNSFAENLLQDVSSCIIDEMVNHVTLLVVKTFSHTSKIIKPNDLAFRRLCLPLSRDYVPSRWSNLSVGIRFRLHVIFSRRDEHSTDSESNHSCNLGSSK